MKKTMVKVTKEFPDKYTGIIRKVGDEFEVTDARYREIKRSGDYVEVVKATEAKAKEKK